MHANTQENIVRNLINCNATFSKRRWLQIMPGACALVTLGYQQINNRTNSCNIPNSCWENRTETDSLHHTKSSPLLVPEFIHDCAQYTSSQLKKIQFKHIIDHLSLTYKWQNLIFTPHNLNIYLQNWKR